MAVEGTPLFASAVVSQVSQDHESDSEPMSPSTREAMACLRAEAASMKDELAAYLDRCKL